MERGFKMNKRRDSKGRILRNGESQRSDGRYAYKYTDKNGKVQFIYSWKLTATDTTPKGKRDCISLREKEKEIQMDRLDGIDTACKKITVCELYAKHINIRKDVSRNTEKGRQILMTILSNDILGMKSIDTVKLSDAKEWITRMHGKGYSFQTINNYKRSLKATFYTAIDDDLIRKNPFNFDIRTVLTDDTKSKTILTKEQKESMLSFAETDTVYKKHIDEIIVLLHTGLRISELCGLTLSDIDFENRVITVDHQLLKDSKLGYYTRPPKTKSGVRKIPMDDKAYDALQNVVKNRVNAQPVNIDGYTDFLFISKTGYPKVVENYGNMLKQLVKKYNRKHTDQLPLLTPHSLRHTFCSHMANAGMNPKALQYIMGHSNITMTLDYYTHVSFDTVKDEMARFTA